MARDLLTHPTTFQTASRIFTGICWLAGIAVLASVLHDPAIPGPSSWVAAVALAAVILVGIPAALLLSFYLPTRIRRGPAQSFRVSESGAILIFGLLYTPRSVVQPLMISAESPDAEQNQFFSLVVDSEGFSFRNGPQGEVEFGWANWDNVDDIFPASISGERRKFNGLALRVSCGAEFMRLEFTCAREGVFKIYGIQKWSEMQRVCEQIKTMKPPQHSGA
jgi:hypothetical protein